MKQTALRICGAVAVLLSSGAVAQEDAALVSQGQELAEKHCSRCHVVNPARPFTGISSTPSFELLVDGFDDWEERFASFYARLPHPSIVRLEDQEPDPNVGDLRAPIELKYSDVDALLAFAASQKHKP